MGRLKQQESMAPKVQELPEIEDKTEGSLYARVDLLKAISEYFNDALPQLGFDEDHTWMNVRILLSMVCWAFGCYAQFATKFPKDRTVIFYCVSGDCTVHCMRALIDDF